MDHPTDKQHELQDTAKSSARPPRSSAATQDFVYFGLLKLLFLLSGLFGTVSLMEGVRLAYNGTRSASWPTVAGTIIESRVTSSQPRRLFGRESEPIYGADITYEFRVGSSRYTGKTISFSMDSVNQSVAENRVQKYPMEMTVSVYYDPNDPRKSVLEPGYRREDIDILLFGVVIGLCFAAFLGWAITGGIPRETSKLSAQRAAASKDPPPPSL